jgi:hypothetical protein
VAVEAHFIHRCRITRPAPDGPDGYRQVRGSPEVVANGVACRLVEKSRTLVSTETHELVTVAGYKLLLPPATDVKVADRVESVTLEDGSEAGSFLVATVLKRRSRVAQFLSADLKEY